MLGIGAPLEIGLSLYSFKYLLSNKPYLIINEEGIRSQDQGFLPWEKITTIDLAQVDNTGVLTLKMIYGKTVQIADGFLQESAKTIMSKIGRYRNIVYSPKLAMFFLEEYPTEITLVAA